MKAAILENQGVMTYQDVPVPAVRRGHALLRVRSASICGSDIKRYVAGHRMYPLILGHECAGVVAQVGEGVDQALIGKHAAVIPLVPCFECPQCAAGRYSACHRYSFIGSRQAGGFAEYVEVPERSLFLVPDTLPLEHAALIEPSTVARHMLALGDFTRGQTAVVLGAGSIGLMIVQWLRILGAAQIVCTDVSDSNLEIAKKLGATVTLNPRKVDVIREIQQLTGDGVDLTLEATGNPAALLQTVPITRPRGKVVLGGNQPLDQSLKLGFIEDMMRRELSLIGCFMSYSAPFPGHEWHDTVQALLSGDLDMETMITHRIGLSAVPDIFAKIGAHQMTHLKIMLNPEA